MWKAFSRSVCEVVERRVGFTAFRSDVTNPKTPDSSQHVKIYCNSQLTRIIPQLKTYCPLKHLKAVRFKQTSHERREDKQQQRNKNHTWGCDPPITACLGAMGWSALVLAWYMCQPLGRRVFGDAYFRYEHKRLPQYICFGQVHAQSPGQPLGIRPLVYRSSSSANSLSSSFTSSSEPDETFSHRRGPFTPEEALDEVSREFEEASRALSGDVENKLGLNCMSKGQHIEAMKHFRRASRHEHAVAAYNLGQCYELGLGTVRNLRKAAKWYKIASDRGQPAAMYNLAIFLANGWGGLREDQRRAHELLTRASRLGLKEASEALSIIDRDQYVSKPQDSEGGTSAKNSTDEFLKMIGAIPTTEPETYSIIDAGQKPTNLSHLDWLDLSSSSLSSSSSNMSVSVEDALFYAGLCLERRQSSISKRQGVVKLRDESGDAVVILHGAEFEPSSGESWDDAANFHVRKTSGNKVA